MLRKNIVQNGVQQLIQQLSKIKLKIQDINTDMIF